MDIVDLDDGQRELFALCLEDWSDDAREAGSKRREWIERFSGRGLGAKLAVDDAGTVGGMIQYLPVEQSFVEGAGLYVIHCIWVHGYRQGRGDYQKRGMGRALLAAAEQDARERGALGMAAWGLWLPMWMKASWFKKRGYRKVDRQGLVVLLFKPFAAEARPPRWYPRARRLPELVEGKVTVTAFSSGWCLARNLVYERARRAAAQFGERVVFREIDTFERAAMAEWGIQDEVLVDNKPVQRGPPPTYDKIVRLIERRVRSL